MGLSRKSFPERFKRRGKAYLECREYHSAGRGGSQTGYKGERAKHQPPLCVLATDTASVTSCPVPQPCLTHHSKLHTHTVNQIDPPILFLAVLWLQHRATWRPQDWVHKGCSPCVLAPPFDSHFCMRKHQQVKARTSKRVLAVIRRRGHPKIRGCKQLGYFQNCRVTLLLNLLMCSLPVAPG